MKEFTNSFTHQDSVCLLNWTIQAEDLGFNLSCSDLLQCTQRKLLCCFSCSASPAVLHTMDLAKRAITGLKYAEWNMKISYTPLPDLYFRFITKYQTVLLVLIDGITLSMSQSRSVLWERGEVSCSLTELCHPLKLSLLTLMKKLQQIWQNIQRCAREAISHHSGSCPFIWLRQVFSPQWLFSSITSLFKVSKNNWLKFRTFRPQFLPTISLLTVHSPSHTQ